MAVRGRRGRGKVIRGRVEGLYLASSKGARLRSFISQPAADGVGIELFT